MLYYNQDFYCVEIHDNEVSCDGILYNNVYEIPAIQLSQIESDTVQKIVDEIKYETNNEDVANEEMIRILLKQIIIKATRIWKTEHKFHEPAKTIELEFIRKFSQLVELHFKNLHTVADYANLLFVTPKNLNKKVTQFGNQSPNKIIKDRIILEVKRLLVHSSLTIKEIGYNLGYEDDAYFIRLFTRQTGVSPQQFRKQYPLK
jgi:AraC-like DNA-binding protein